MRYVLALMFLAGLVVMASSPQANTASAPESPKTINVIVTGDAIGYPEPCG